MDANLYQQFQKLYGVESKEQTKASTNEVLDAEAQKKRRRRFLNPIERKSIEPKASKYFRIQKLDTNTQLRITGDPSASTSRLPYSVLWFKAKIEGEDGKVELKTRTHVFQSYAPLIVRPFTVRQDIKGDILEDTVIGGAVERTSEGVLTISPSKDVSAVVATTTTGDVLTFNVSPEQSADLIADPSYKGDRASIYISSHLAKLRKEYKETGDPSELEKHNAYFANKYLKRGTKTKPRPITVEDPITMMDLYNKTRQVIVTAYEVATHLVDAEYDSVAVVPLTPEEVKSTGSTAPFKLALEKKFGKVSVPLHNGDLQLLNIAPAGDRAIFGDAGLYNKDGVGNDMFKIHDGVDIYITKVEKDNGRVEYTYDARRHNSAIQGIDPLEAMKTGFLDPFALYIDSNDRSQLLIDSYKYYMNIVDEDTVEELPFQPDTGESSDTTDEESFEDAL